jgi:hypothetical protein
MVLLSNNDNAHALPRQTPYNNRCLKDRTCDKIPVFQAVGYVILCICA